MKVLNVKDYGIFPGVKERKNTWYLRKMVEKCEHQEATEIFFRRENTIFIRIMLMKKLSVFPIMMQIQ